MKIVCTTNSAALEVLHILLNSGLRLYEHFEVGAPDSSPPPYYFRQLKSLPESLLAEVMQVPDTIIVPDAAA